MGITPQQFAQMNDRLRGRRRVAEPVFDSSYRPAGTRVKDQIILGLDPSMRGTGYGIVRMIHPQPVALAHGTIRCPPAWEHSRCLVLIAQGLREVIRKYHPTVCAVEGLFFAQNLQTAILMGEARGAGLVAAGEAGLEIYEMAPRKVKQAIVGYGAAQKLAVSKMVQRLLKLAEPPEPDAADALALALAYAQEAGRFAPGAPKRV